MGAAMANPTPHPAQNTASAAKDARLSSAPRTIRRDPFGHAPPLSTHNGEGRSFSESSPDVNGGHSGQGLRIGVGRASQNLGDAPRCAGFGKGMCVGVCTAHQGDVDLTGR